MPVTNKQKVLAQLGLAPSKMDEILAGAEIDENDWAAEGQKRVQNGSDGLWLRFGAQPDGSCKAQFFAFRLNPCVSLFSLILLFALVAMCNITPGTYCSVATATYTWTDGSGTVRVMQERTRVFGDPAPDTGYKLYHNAGTWPLDSGTANVAAAIAAGTNGGITVSQKLWSGTTWGAATTHTGTQATRLENKECFMPQKEFQGWMAWTTEWATWLYVITQDLWIFFILAVAVKYGNIKMSKDDNDAPEFSDFGFFAMLFTCGVATGLFFYAVSEPQYYYLIGKTFNGNGNAVASSGYYERNRWTYAGVFQNPADGAEVPVYNTINNRVQEAMTTTFFHWGLHGWVLYCLVGLLLGFMHFRKGLPMTIKSCFYPLIGTRIYGFFGDAVDTISVVATTMGVCTSLGMGVMQLNSGIEYLNGNKHWFGEPYYNTYNVNDWKDDYDSLKGYWDSWPAGDKGQWLDPATGAVNVAEAAKVATIVSQNDQQIFLIVMVSILATCSVLLGLKNGIKNLAILSLLLGQFMIFYVWMMDDSWFLTNLFVQSLGDYVAKFFTIGFYCSAVEQSEVNNAYGEYQSWQYWWTIFYWGWWIAWCPFVGVFLARLARGRTIREFITAIMIGAVLYNLLFLNVLGGAGLKMQLLAEKHGVGTTSCTDSNMYGKTVVNGVETWGIVTAGQAGLDESTLYTKTPYKQNICRKVSSGKYSGQGEMFCSTVTNLGCTFNVRSADSALFDVVGQYGETSKFMIAMVLVSLALYFVASSDSGSMTDDMICANGMPEPNLIQRLVWASTECAAACSLMSAGKYVGHPQGALRALRACSIVVGIPYTFIALLMTVALWKALQFETGERKWGAGFKTHVADFGITLYTCGAGKERVCNFEAGKIDATRMINNIIGFCCPVVPLMKIGQRLDQYEEKHSGMKKVIPGRLIKAIVVTVIYYAAWLLILLDYAPVKDGPVEWGSIHHPTDNYLGNNKYFQSNKYGFYKQWANDGIDTGDEIKWNVFTEEMRMANEVPLTQTINNVNIEVTVGDASSKSRRIATYGWFFILCVFFTYITQVRTEVRSMYNIPGSVIEDYFCACLWPNALSQLSDQCLEPDVEEPIQKQVEPVEEQTTMI